jgi:glycosyltransferase involved in cell wall biosynthesis
MQPHTLYLSHNGILAGVGRSQVVPYLEAFGADYRITLISIEQTWDPIARARMRERLERSGIAWHPVRHHDGRSPLRRAWDAGQVLLTALRIVRRDSVRLVHARSYIAAAIAWILRRLTGVPFIFDLRGRLIDEYLEDGYLSPSSALVLVMRKLERRCLAEASAVVVLTPDGRDQLYAERLLPPGRSVDVIPCCVNTSIFADVDAAAVASTVDRLGLRERLVLAYVGSPILGELPEEMLRFFAALKARRADACLLIVTAQQPIFASALGRAGVPSSDFRLLTVQHEEMPIHLHAAHAAVNFVRPSPTKRASSSIKKAECLAAGLPLVLSSGAEDHDALLGAASVGVLVRAFEAEAYAEAADALLRLLDEGEALRRRCRAVAESWYGLNTVGIPRYAAIYRRLAQPQVDTRTEFVDAGIDPSA